MAKRTSNQGMKRQFPFVEVTLKLCKQLPWAPIAQRWGGNHCRPPFSSVGS